MYTQEFWSVIRTFQNDHYMLDDISYLDIIFGILMKIVIINYIILLAKYYTKYYTSECKRLNNFLRS